ncbi:hypothetical protein AGMMS50267_06160 [Spirochaetia bacterium]|nr:hypothetical protein AGMMS50267_06160 [Spirochaetia bacterium]
MKRIETPEEIRRRIKRFQRRENSIQRAERKRGYQAECKKKDAAESIAVVQILRADRKKSIMLEKKSDGSKLLKAFSYIDWTPFDKRDKVPKEFKTRFFNKERQYIDFFKSYIYPYPIPVPVLFTTLQNDYHIDKHGNREKSFYYDIITLSKKWMRDIVSGDSFYRRNKEYFTKSESHYFLNTSLPFIDISSFLMLFFHAKCKARNMNTKFVGIISKVFTIKFEKCFNHTLVTGFLDLLSRSYDYHIDEGELGDICDFILPKIRRPNKFPSFTFSGRTMTSIIALTNEWHADIQREQEALGMLIQREQEARGIPARAKKQEARGMLKWVGMNIPTFRFETDECTWKVTQLLTVQDLLNEGRKMKSCVSSYTYQCLHGECSIFNLSAFYNETQLIGSYATLEVSKDRSLVQAKAKCNFKVIPKAMNVINRWAQANGIKNRIL